MSAILDVTKKTALPSTVRPGGDRAFDVVCSTPDIDADSDRLFGTSWDLSRFRQNPVVLLGHNHGSLPVAQMENIRVEGGCLRGKIQFPPAGVSPRADEVHDLMAGGFVRGVSVGFRPKKSTPNAHGGVDYDSVELLE